MQKNVAGQKIGCQMISATDGSNFTGSVTVYVTGDAGTQSAGSVGAGACTHEGKGYHTYAPAQAETNYDLIAFTFEGTGAVTATVQVETRCDANLTHSAGTAITSSGGRPEVNTTHAAGTAWNSGAIGASTLASDTITAAKIAADAIGASELAADAVTEIQSGLATASALSSLQTDVTTLLGRITSTLFSGITSLAQWLGMLAGKQTGNTTARTEIRATGAGSGTYDETTDSLEAVRDRGDAAWITATGFSTHSAADVWAVATRVLTAGTNIQLPSNGLANISAWTVNITGTLSGNVGGIAGTTNTFDALQAALNSAHGAGSWATATGFSTHSAADVWAVGTRVLTAGTNIQLPSNGLANVTTWTVGITGNITGNLSGSVGSVTTVSDKTGYALSSTGLNLVIPADPGTTEPTFAGNSTIVQWIAYFGAWSVNPVLSDSNSVNLRNTANNADLAAHVVSDDGTTFTNGAAG